MRTGKQISRAAEYEVVYASWISEGCHDVYHITYVGPTLPNLYAVSLSLWQAIVDCRCCQNFTANNMESCDD
jgi:hypothetical protein